MQYVSQTRSVTSPRATLIVLHGLGSDEQDMFGLADLIDDGVEVVCLRAPLAYGPGFAWFNIEWTPTGIHVDEQEYWTAVDRLASALTALDKPNLILGGFSQGAMMSLGLITKYPDLGSNCVLLSGRGIQGPCPNFKGNIFQAHGRYDEVIPISEARTLRTALLPLGDRHEYHEYDMPHSVCDQELSDLNAWLARILQLE